MNATSETYWTLSCLFPSSLGVKSIVTTPSTRPTGTVRLSRVASEATEDGQTLNCPEYGSATG